MRILDFKLRDSDIAFVASDRQPARLKLSGNVILTILFSLYSPLPLSLKSSFSLHTITMKGFYIIVE